MYGFWLPLWYLQTLLVQDVEKLRCWIAQVPLWYDNYIQTYSTNTSAIFYEHILAYIWKSVLSKTLLHQIIYGNDEYLKQKISLTSIGITFCTISEESHTDGPLLASTCNIILPTFVGDIYKLVPLDNPAATCKMNENRNYWQQLNGATVMWSFWVEVQVLHLYCCWRCKDQEGGVIIDQYNHATFICLSEAMTLIFNIIHVSSW